MNQKNSAVILKGDFPYANPAFVNKLIESLKLDRAVSIATGEDIAHHLADEAVDTLVLPDARFFPTAAKAALIAYLERGGNLIAVGGPAFSEMEADDEPLILETLCPAEFYPYRAYKTFRLKDAVRLEPYDKQFIFGNEVKLESPGELICPIWRPRGLGIQEKCDYRWIPLVSAYDAEGQFRGTPVSMMVNVDNRFAGSVWGLAGFADGAFLDANSEYVINIVKTLLARMDSGAFLSRAGTDRFGYVTGERITVGARTIDGFSEIKTIIRSGDRELFRIAWTPCDGADLREEVALEGQWSKPDKYTIETTAFIDGKAADIISYEFSVIDADRKLGPDLVTVKDGDFYLRGEKWYPIGINFWPLYCAGHETYEYRHLSWLSPEQYDPEWIDLDLDQLVSLGMNSVSIQCPNERCVPPAMDFLERCRERGIKVNISVDGHPIDGNPERSVQLIELARLANNDTVYTWDLAWEPHLGPEEDRKKLDGRWLRWITDRYGSVENAEKDWEFAVTRPDGSVSGPTDNQLINDGPWRGMVAAYRRFADDIISKGYLHSRRVISKADPNHLFGVRTGCGGTGQPGIAHWMAFDLISGIKHLDYTSPEGYGLGGDYINYRRAGLLNVYARFVANGKPVFWSEYGVPHYFQGNTKDWSEEGQTAYFRDMHRMFMETDVSGGAGWWWPGGHRVDENSDFGIINPDRSPRPAALEIKKVAEQFKNMPQRKEPDYRIEIDRDSHVLGLAMVWIGNWDEYIKALDEGKTVGLKTKGTGTDSSNTPMIAVGNTPINGHNPPKFLNAEFNWLLVRNSAGEWIEVEDGAQVKVAAGQPVSIRASVGNTAESTWLTPVEAGDANGGVYLCAGDGQRWPLQARTPYLSDAEFSVELPATDAESEAVLWLIAENRSPFGEKIRFRLVV